MTYDGKETAHKEEATTSGRAGLVRIIRRLDPCPLVWKITPDPWTPDPTPWQIDQDGGAENRF